MLSKKDMKIFFILDLISSSDKPLGAGKLSNLLRKKGIIISEATVGRVLHELENQSLLLKKGKRGRSLSESGKALFFELGQKLERNEIVALFLKTLRNHEGKSIIDILTARKAIERETSRLAAIKSTPSDIRSLKDIIIHQEKRVNQGQSIADIDTLFHNQIARASKNIVLETMLSLIWQETYLAPSLEYMRNKMNRGFGYDHTRIFDAIANHDPGKAEKEMITHMDNVLKDVQAFIEQQE